MKKPDPDQKPDMDAEDFRGMIDLDEAVERFKKRVKNGDTIVTCMVPADGNTVWLMTGHPRTRLTLEHAEKLVGSLQRSIAMAREFQKAASN